MTDAELLTNLTTQFKWPRDGQYLYCPWCKSAGIYIGVEPNHLDDCPWPAAVERKAEIETDAGQMRLIE